MFLVIGLGNPGKKYENTRHNAGRILIDKLAKKFIYPPDDECFEMSKKLHAQICKTNAGSDDLVLAKTEAFMNETGPVVRKLLDYFKAEPSKIVIASDDTYLKLGQSRIKFGGESGGHKGLESIIGAIGKDFWRIRIGIGEKTVFKLEDFVLQKFSSLERKILDETIDKTAEDLVLSISQGQMTSKTVGVLKNQSD